MTVDTRTLFFTGCYTRDAGGTGEGIGLIDASVGSSPEALGVAAATSSPSFVATHPTAPVLYAVCEFAGTVQAHSIDSGAGGIASLTPLGESWSTGDSGCHVAVDPNGRFVLVTCYGDGQVLLFGLDPRGIMISRTVAPKALDPHAAKNPDYPALGTARQSRAHASLVLPGGRILTTDLGLDVVRVWHHDRLSGLVRSGAVTLPFESGPRHLALHPDGRVFVVTEYSRQVFTLSPAPDGGFEVTSVTPVAAGDAEVGTAPADTCAHIELSADGRHAYVGIRGSNRIAVLAVDEAGAHPVAVMPSGGDWPRHHLVHDGMLHVAHERSHVITSFVIDGDTGLIGDPVASLATGSPTCIALAR